MNKLLLIAVCSAVTLLPRIIPYFASSFLMRLPRFVRKCTFCRDKRQLVPDAQPYCVETCHQKARIFGDLDDPNSEVSKLIGSVKTDRIFTEIGTDPQIYYIPCLGGQA